MLSSIASLHLWFRLKGTNQICYLGFRLKKNYLYSDSEQNYFGEGLKPVFASNFQRNEIFESTVKSGLQFALWFFKLSEAFNRF